MKCVNICTDVWASNLNIWFDWEKLGAQEYDDRDKYDIHYTYTH